MSRGSNIRWREIDNKELKRINKNYKAKIARERKKLLETDQRYQAAQLPQTFTFKELKSEIKTRADYNRVINQMQNYIKTGDRFILDANTKKSLHATVRDFGNKIDRLIEKGVPAHNLPEKITSEDLMKVARTKDSLKQILKDYKGFLKRGAEELVELPDSKFNIKLTRWQKETAEMRIAQVNAERDRQRAEWEATEVKYGGKSANYTQGQVRMDDGTPDDYKHMKLHNYSSTYVDMREKWRLIMRESQEGYWEARTELAKLNYLDTMEKVIGNHPVGKMLLQQIRKAPLSEFKRVLLSEDDLFLMLYDLKQNPENFEIALETVWNEWNPDKDMNDEIENHIRRFS